MNVSDFPDATVIHNQTKKNENPRSSHLRRLLVLIEEQSKQGSYELNTDIVLSEDVIKILKDKGYNVNGKNCSFLQYPSWTISW